MGSEIKVCAGVGSESSPRILSIQSHVVSGYVGNKSAVFPLQVLGFEVDFINSVQFSNHTGYGTFKGQILGADQLGELYEGLVANDLHRDYTHILTGYIGSTSFLEKVVEVVRHLKSKNSSLVYVCDPVMGDDGVMYVDSALLPIYRDVVLPVADVVTPNQFEAELLTGVKITDMKSTWRAVDFFHSKGVGTVVISSTNLGGDERSLLGLASRLSPSSTIPSRLSVSIPKLEAHFTGTGDLFASLLTAWLHHHPGELKLALEKVLSTMSAVLRRTLEMGRRLAGGETPGVAHLELKLIQSRKDIEEPGICVRVDPVETD